MSGTFRRRCAWLLRGPCRWARGRCQRLEAMEFDLVNLAKHWVSAHPKTKLEGQLLELIQKQMFNGIIDGLRIRNERGIVIQTISARNVQYRHRHMNRLLDGHDQLKRFEPPPPPLSLGTIFLSEKDSVAGQVLISENGRHFHLGSALASQIIRQNDIPHNHIINLFVELGIRNCIEIGGNRRQAHLKDSTRYRDNDWTAARGGRRTHTGHSGRECRG